MGDHNGLQTAASLALVVVVLREAMAAIETALEVLAALLLELGGREAE